MTSPIEPGNSLAKAGEQIVSQVYADAFQPSTREIGHALQSVVRTALRTVHALVWTVDQAFDWVEDAVQQKLANRGVTEDRIVSPTPHIVAGVIKGVRVTGGERDADLREMYANLLTTAMDAETALTAHPAFAELLQQMTADEARIINLLGDRDGRALVEITVHSYRHRGGLDVLGGVKSDEYSGSVRSLGNEAGCAHSEMVLSYADNLKRLGLVSVERASFRTHPKDFTSHPPAADEVELRSWIWNYRFSEVSELLRRLKEFRGPQPRGSSEDIRVVVMALTTFGKQFLAACGPGEVSAET